VLENLINHYNVVIMDIIVVDGFTQIVWKKTTRIGLTFGYEQYQYKVLAVYYPFGNLLSKFSANVTRPKNSQPARDFQIHELVYLTGDYIHFK